MDWSLRNNLKTCFMTPFIAAAKYDHSGIVHFFTHSEEAAWTSNIFIRPLLVRNVTPGPNVDSENAVPSLKNSRQSNRAITRFALRPALFNASFENTSIWRTAHACPTARFAHVGVELGVSPESAGHRRPKASVAYPCFQRNCCDASCLEIKCDWDGKPQACQRSRVSSAINKDRTRQHSPRLIMIQAGP